MINVLIVEDEFITREYLLKCIDWTGIGCEVIGSLENGIEAVEFLKNKANTSADIIITDIRMPGMNGLDLSKYVKDNYKDIEIIILTGHSEFNYAQKALKYGVSDLILKPADQGDISDAINKIKEKMVNIKYTTKLSQYYENNFIDDFIDGMIEINEVVRARLLDNIGSNEICKLILIKILNQSEQSNEIINSLRVEGEKIACECEFRCIFKFTLKHLCIIVLYDKQENSYIVKDRLKHFCSNLQKNIKDNMNLKLSIIISKSLINFDEIPTVYKNLLIKHRESSFINESDLLFEEEIINNKCNISTSISYPIEKIIYGVKVYDTKLVKKEMLNMFELVYINYMDIDTTKKMYFEIVISCMMAIIDKNTEDNNSGLNCTSIYNVINNINTLNELNAWMSDIILKMLESHLDYGLKADNKVIQKALDYIEKNYMKEITLNLVADYIHLHPVYFARLLKKEIGETFCELILRIRISKAKNLLENTSLKTYEIATKVGFSDARYFGQVFKKSTSMTPKEFRERVQTLA